MAGMGSGWGTTPKQKPGSTPASAGCAGKRSWTDPIDHSPTCENTKRSTRSTLFPAVKRVNPLNGLILCNPDTLELVYPNDVRSRIERHVTWTAAPHTRLSVLERPEVLREVEVLFAGWSLPSFDDAFLDR